MKTELIKTGKWAHKASKRASVRVVTVEVKKATKGVK